MAKIQSFPKTKLKYAEWLAVCEGIILKILSANADVTQFKPQFENFQTCTKEFSNSLSKLSKSEYTLKSNEVRRRSNAARTSLFNYIRSFKTSKDPVKQAAYISLMVVVEHYAGMSMLSFVNLIGYTDKLIGIIESDTYKGCIATLDLTDRLEALRIINNESKDIYSKKMEENGRRNIRRKPDVTHRELNVAYDKLVATLNALATINGDTDFIVLFSWWNAMIDDWRTKISLRYGAKKGGKSDNGDSSQSDNPSTGGGDDDRPVIE